MKKQTKKVVSKSIIRNPIGDENIYTRFSDGAMAFKRTTNRYAPKGTISHNNNIAYGMKFNYKDNDLDIAINNHVFKNGFNSNIENVLNEIDIQDQY